MTPVPWRHRGRRVTLALALACAIGLALAAFGATSALAQKAEQTRKPAQKVKALVLGQASSPVLKELKGKRGWQFTQAANAQGRGSDPSKYDVLVVDGDAHSPGQLGEGTLVDRFADANQWVLALDVDPADYDGGLKEHTGFTAGERSEKSSAFLFSRQILSNTPHVLMVEAKHLRPIQFGDVSKEELLSIIATQTQKVASTATRAVSANRSTLEKEFTAQQGGDAPPAEIQSIKWDHNVIDPAVNPDPGYWTQNKPSSGVVKVPEPGTQWTSKTMTRSFGVYLDNGAGNPQGNYQYVTYDFSGAFAPKHPTVDGVPTRFFQMDDPFTVGDIIHYKENMERAWWTGMWNVTAEADESTSPKLFPVESKPATPNEQTQYTVGQQFKVGFSFSKDGPNLSGDYTYNEERTNQIPDWGVENRSAEGKLNWLFSSRSPCDPRESADPKKCFDNATVISPGMPLRPNELSLGQLPVRTSALWKTTSALAGNDGKAKFYVDDPVTVVSTFCSKWFTGCDRFEGRNQILRTQEITDTQGPTPYTFDIAAVNPIPVQSLTLAPNPANGTKSDKVTGTVTLERPAPIDVRVRIFSSSENATVGAPDPNGRSSTTITIPMGKTSGTFEVLTNDNRLSPGQHTTATITAFYAKDTSTQLRVEATKKGSSTAEKQEAKASPGKSDEKR